MHIGRGPLSLAICLLPDVPTLLLVDDQPEALNLLSAFFEEAGYAVHAAANGAAALRLLFQQRPDLVVTGTAMPGMTGFDLIARIRELSDVPILVLSVIEDGEEKARALKLGANDYLTKAQGLQELLARVQALLGGRPPEPTGERGSYRDGVLTILFDRHEVLVRDRRVALSPKEMKLLALLVQRADRVVTVREILEGVWGSLDYSGDSVKWHIASLRRKIEENPREPRLIVTVWGLGYRYDRPTATLPERIERPRG